jgi:flagellar basal body-associated protein FliL
MENETKDTIGAPDLSGEEMKMPENSSMSSESSEGSQTPVNGIIIAILALLLIFILGGMYYWFSQLTTGIPTETPVSERPTAEENNEPESTNAEATVETQGALSTSDEITAIEADIAATELDSLDAELKAIDAELDAALDEGN